MEGRSHEIGVPSFNQIEKLLMVKQGSDERTIVGMKSRSSSYFKNFIVSPSLAAECRIVAARGRTFVPIILWFK